MSLDDVDINFQDVLGNGSFCRVFRVKLKHKDGCDYYALKRLRVSHHNNVVARHHLQQESALLSLLTGHSHIVHLQGYCLEAQHGSPFIVTELLTELLETRVKEWQKGENHDYLPWNHHPVPSNTEVITRLQDICMGVARGIAYLHSKHILFRDIKPDNVGFDGKGRVKLFDFGLAVRLEPPQFLCKERAGTVRYLAPEVAARQAFSYPADVYSFSIFLWQILTSRLPFRRELGGSDEIPVDIDDLHFLPPNKRPSLKFVESESLQTLLAKMWNENPEERPTFDEIIERLELVVKELTPKLRVRVEPPIDCWWSA